MSLMAGNVSYFNDGNSGNNGSSVRAMFLFSICFTRKFMRIRVLFLYSYLIRFILLLVIIN